MANILYLRNIISGEIRQLEAFSDEHKAIRTDRDPDTGDFVWQETSAADACPEEFAHPTEIAARSRWGVKPLSFVTADGTPTSKAAADALAKAVTARVNGPAVHGLSRDPDHPEAGPIAGDPKQSKRQAAKPSSRRAHGG